MPSSVEKVRNYIAERHLFENDDRPIIVGLSGGADSIALCSILHSLGYQIICAHCNFHLRGDESDRDARHSKAIADMLGLQFVSSDFNVEAYLSAQSVSTEEACRNLRYNWFESIRISFNAQKIAVGHNRNDNIETFFFNLQRGTGISGLTGISSNNNRLVVRPLLCLTRQEIEQYLHEQQLPFITDCTNLQSIYSRNKIRNIVLPNIRENFPNIDNGILTTIANMEEVSAAYHQFIQEKKSVYTDSKGNIDLKRLIDNESLPDLMLYEWLKSEKLTRSQARDIVTSHKSTGAIFQTSHASYIIDRGSLIRISEHPDNNIQPLDHYFSITTITVGEMSESPEHNCVYFNNSVLSGDPLTIRFWQKGDRIKPFGMTGSKKVSDIFSDAKISRVQKHHIPILCKGNEILWVAGLRRSSLFPVDKESSKEVIKVTYLSSDPDID